MTRFVVLLVLVAAFAPAAVMGALPLVLPSVLTLLALTAAVALALPQRAADPAPVEPDQR